MLPSNSPLAPFPLFNMYPLYTIATVHVVRECKHFIMNKHKPRAFSNHMRTTQEGYEKERKNTTNTQSYNFLSDVHYRLILMIGLISEVCNMW